MSRNRIRLNICGAEFALTSDDSESYIHAIAEEVEAGITEMVEKNPHISITTAGIISALNYCDAQHKAEDAADNLRSQIKDYLEDAASAKMAAEEARRENVSLKRRIDELERRLRCRGTEDEETIQRRLKRAETEIANSVNYDEHVVNIEVDSCAESLYSIIQFKLQHGSDE